MLNIIKKPEELPKKGKKKHYVNLYEKYINIEKKYTDLLLKYDELKKKDEKKDKKINELENKIINYELLENELSMDIHNIQGKTIRVVDNTIDNLKKLKKELENKVYQDIIEDSYHECLLDDFKKEKKFNEKLAEVIEEEI